MRNPTVRVLSFSVLDAEPDVVLLSGFVCDSDALAVVFDLERGYRRAGSGIVEMKVLCIGKMFAVEY